MKKKSEFIIAVILLLIIASAICGCTTTRYVTVPEYHYKDSIHTIYKRDSIYNRDSIFIYSKGDTIFHEHYNVKYKEYLRTDTINLSKTDSIKVPYPVTKTVTVHKMYSFQKTFMWIGIAFIAGILVYLIWKLKGKIKI